MTDIALTADAHMNLFRRYNSFFPHVEKAFEFFYNQCKNQNVQYIFVCGDLFHTKNYTATDALLKANDILHNLSQIAEIHMIPGNHDKVMNDDTEVNLLNNYKYYKNIYVHNEYEWLTINGTRFDFLPFKREDILKKEIANIKCNGESCVLISHLGVAGFHLHEGAEYGYVDRSSQVAPADLKKFKRVFLGHYHGFQENGNTIYVSAPFQSRHGDENSKHGFIFYESITNEAKFIENPFSPRFITMDFTKDNIQKLMSVENCFIKLNINRHISKELLMAVKYRLLKKNCDVDYKFNIIPQNAQFATIEGWDTITYTTTDDLLIGFVKNLQNQNKINSNFNEKELLDIILQ